MLHSGQPGPAPPPVLRLGSWVYYVLAEGPSAGEIRPALVTKIWQPALLNLQVFPDGFPQANDCLPVPYWVNTAPYDAGKRPHSWHFA